MIAMKRFMDRIDDTCDAASLHLHVTIDSFTELQKLCYNKEGKPSPAVPAKEWIDGLREDVDELSRQLALISSAREIMERHSYV